jgi:transposase
MANRQSRPTLTAKARAELELFERSSTTPARMRRRARVVLLLDQGRTGVQVARQSGYTVVQVSRLRRRFFESGLAGLWDKPRSGRPSVMPDTMAVKVLARALWTSDTRELVRLAQVSRNTMDRFLRAHGLLPPPGSRSKVRRNPYSSTIYEIAGLYLNPPINAAVIAEGYPLGQDYEIRRSALPRLQEALSVAQSSPPGVFQRRPKTTRLWKFLRKVACAQHGQIVHVILEQPDLKRSERPHNRSRVMLHPTPKPLSWLTVLKVWLDTLPRQSVCWTSSASVEATILTIDQHLQRWQVKSRPFMWTKEPPLFIKYSAAYRFYRDNYGKY